MGGCHHSKVVGASNTCLADVYTAVEHLLEMQLCQHGDQRQRAERLEIHHLVQSSIYWRYETSPAEVNRLCAFFLSFLL